MQPDRDSITILHACSGNQLKILLALKLLGVNAPIVDIAAISNINRNTVSEALNALAVLGYVESVDRYHWRLTTTCVQLPLWTPTQLEESSENTRDAKNSCVQDGSSSSSRTPESMDPTTTTTRPDAKNPCVQPPPPPVAELLAIGVAREHAANTIARATAAGLTVNQAHVVAWRHYCRDRPTINNPGAFICARLAAGQTAPPDATKPPAPMTAEERHARYVPPGYEHLIEH